MQSKLIMETRHIQHLYWRAGFGISPKDLNNLIGKSRDEIVEDLFYESRRPVPIDIDHSEFRNLNIQHLLEDKVELRKVKEQMKLKLVDLNLAWIERLSNPKGLLREKMTLFWANHFVCRENMSMYAEKYNNTLRENALGNLRSFTKAVSREAAMIKYLNLKNNRRKRPNENFARELMELFLLGNHHYTEKDIKQSARAFTGYDFDFLGGFKFRRMLHDYGRKTFFGRKGMFSGDDIIDIILLEKQCARFICEKIYAYFVKEEINQNHIEDMVKVFYPNYDIEKLMRFIFMSDWFYEEENIGTKIKSPIEFLVGIDNVVPLKFTNSKKLLGMQMMLGQILLYPPNVSGWKGGKGWIDSNTILLRLRLPSILLSNAIIPPTEKNDFIDKFYTAAKRKRTNNLFKVEPNWKQFSANYENVEIETMSNYLFQSGINRGTKKLLDQITKASKGEFCVQLMSLPEYQMC